MIINTIRCAQLTIHYFEMKAIAALAFLATAVMASEWGYDYAPYRAGHARGYGYAAPAYRPAVVRKDYGAWEKHYRLDVETLRTTVVTDTENVWVVAYIDPACGGCKRLAVEWERVTTVERITTRRVKFGYVDVTVEQEKEVLTTFTGGKAIEYTPTVYLYGEDKYHPVEYVGDYKFDSLVDYICGYCDDHGFGVIVDDGLYGGYGLGRDYYGRGLGYGRGAYAIRGAYGLGGLHGRRLHGRGCRSGLGLHGRRAYGHAGLYGRGLGYGYAGYGRGLGYGYAGYGRGLYDDGLYGRGLGYGYGGYGYAAPAVVGVAGSSRTRQTVRNDYARDVREGGEYGAYGRVSVRAPRAHYW